MKKILFIMLVLLASCEKPELIVENGTACSPVTELKEVDNVVTWKGEGPFVIERYDMYGWPWQRDTINVSTMKYDRFTIGYVRVKPVCASGWSRYLYIKG